MDSLRNIFNLSCSHYQYGKNERNSTILFKFSNHSCAISLVVLLIILLIIYSVLFLYFDFVYYVNCSFHLLHWVAILHCLKMYSIYFHCTVPSTSVFQNELLFLFWQYIVNWKIVTILTGWNTRFCSMSTL